MAKACIAVLTRGYENIMEYVTLVRRNQSISHYLKDKTIPILIFHEGNISEQQQHRIQGQTSELMIQFIDIKKDGLAFKKEKEAIPHLRGQYPHFFGMGYRHMCHFWFVDFWNFVKDYDILLRVDEDCILESSLDSILHKMETAPGDQCLWTGKIEDDQDFVCVGLNEFTRVFIGNNAPIKYPPSGPYTNLFGLRLDRVRSNYRLMEYIQAIEKSNGIYENRWGDLPLWGEAVTYILGDDALVVDKDIRYYHGTHYVHVNAVTEGSL